MLAALRVLHVDTSHTPAELAAIEERPSLLAYQLYPARTLVSELSLLT
jgi:hypothetical protein